MKKRGGYNAFLDEEEDEAEKNLFQEEAFGLGTGWPYHTLNFGIQLIINISIHKSHMTV